MKFSFLVFLKKYQKVLLVLFFIFIIFWYFWHISNYWYFWMDEAWDTSVAWSWLNLGKFGNPTYPINSLNELFFLHPPLPIIMEAGLIKLFGINPFSIRFWSIIMGLGSILFLYLLVKKLFGNKVAFFSAVFLATNPLFFIMSRQFRPEVFVTFFVLASSYILYLAKLKKKNYLYFISGLLTGAAFLSHFYGAFYIGACILYLIIELIKKRIKIQELFLFIFGAAVLLVPYFYWIFVNFSIFKTQFTGNLGNLTNINEFLKYLISEIQRYIKQPKIIPLILFTFLIIYIFSKKIWQKFSLVIIYLISFLLGLALFMPNKTVKYLTPIFPVCALAGGLALAGSFPKYLSQKLIFIFRFLGLALVLVSVFYSVSIPMQMYPKEVSYYKLDKETKKTINEYYSGGSIGGDPTYWLFLPEELRTNFISEHAIFKFRNKNESFEEIFQKNQITLFFYSPEWWDDFCRGNEYLGEELKNFLREKGVLVGTIQRSLRDEDSIFIFPSILLE